MSALAQKADGYLHATRSTGNPRDVEYQLFSRTTGRLNRASRSDAAFAELAAALNENVELWREIALDVASAENGLSRGLRAQLFYLFEFTVAHTQKVLRREANASALIDVNMAIMRGLKARSPGKGTDPCQASS